jgi:predicted nucleic acid-binding protein
VGSPRQREAGLTAHVLFLDAFAVIYLVEGVAPFATGLAALLKRQSGGNGTAPLAVSELSRLECRAQPMRLGNAGLLRRYDEFFAADALVQIALLSPVIEMATLVRARDRLATPDALQAACCLSLGGKARFVTADASFQRVTGLDAILL